MEEKAWELGGIDLKSRIGQGGMGEVWWGVHRLRGEEVAVKIMGAPGEKGEGRARVMEEIRAVARLNHRRVVRVYDSGRVGEAGSVYLVMELASGTLMDVGAGTLGWAVVKLVLTQILEGLAHSHSRGVIHRDLKPENILLFDGKGSQRMGVKISDFGLAYARAREGHKERGEISYGTPSFMAPERVEGRWRDQGPWTDLYGLGCVAYWLVTGRAPFEGRDTEAIAEAQVLEELGSLGEEAAVPPGFEAWLDRLVDKDRRRRYQRAAEALAGLEALGGVAESDEEGLGQMATEAVSETWDEWRPVRMKGLGDWRRREEERGSPELVGMGLGLVGLRTSPMVGRVEERDRIWARLKQVIEKRRARAVMVSGESGLGATRLVRWMAQRAHEKGAAEILELNQGVDRRPGVAMAQMVREALGCQGLDRRGLEARLERLSGEEGALSTLGAVMRQDLVDLMMATGQGDKSEVGRRIDARRIGSTLVRWIQALAQERPVVLIVDDAQWGSEGLTLVEGLLESSREAPVLALVTHDGTERRREEGAKKGVERLRQHTRVEELELGPLSAGEHAELIDGILSLEPGLAEEVWERTEGQPLFAVELVREWIAEGVLEPSKWGYRWKEEIEWPRVESLEELLEAKIERFLATFEQRRRGDAEQALEMGAALGHRVRFEEWWRSCLEAELDAGQGIYERLLERDLVKPWAGGWAFAQGSLRGCVERRARREGRWEAHHRVCLKVLDKLYGDERGAVQNRRAYHLMEAGEREEALGPMLEALKHLVETSQMEAAGEVMERVEELSEELGIPRWDGRWIKWLAQRSVWHGRQGQIEEGWAVVEAMGEALEEGSGGESWGAYYYHRAYYLHLKGEPLASNEWAQKGLERYREVGDRHGEASTRYLMALNASWVGDLELMGEDYRRAYEIFEALGDEANRAKSMIGRGSHRSMVGDHEGGVELIEEGIAIYEAIGDPYAAAVGYSNLGEVQWRLGALARARRSLETGMALMEAVGSGDMTLYLNLCCVLIADEAFEEAEEVLEALLDELEGAKREGLLGVCYATYLPIMAHRKDWEGWDANMVLAAGYLRANTIVDKDLAWTFEVAGEMAKEAGEEQRARAAMEQAKSQWERLG